MAENDITVGMTLEDAAAMAKLNEFESKLGRIQEKARMASGPMSGILTPIPEVFGGPKGASMTPLLDAATEAAKRNAGATKELTEATNELGEETQKAGINIESMMTRMALRFAIMEAARLAIQGIVGAFKEMSALETARIQFENLTASMYHTVEIEEKLQQTTLETGVAAKDLTPAFISLEEAGYGPEQVTDIMNTLAKVTAATGIPTKELGKGLLDLDMDKATVPEMFKLAEGTGEAKDATIAAVQEYAELERSIKLADHARDDELATMREQVAVQEQLINEEIRAAEVEEKAAVQRIDAAEKAAAAQEKSVERQISAQEKLAGVQQSFLGKVLGEEGKPPGQADPTLARAMQPGGLPETAGGQQMTKDIQLGFQEIYKEEGLTTAGMQHYVDTGVIGLRDILAAAKRVHEAEKEARQDKAAETKDNLEAEKAAAEKKLTDIKTEGDAEIRKYQDTIANMAKEDAAAKKKERVDLDQKRLELEGLITGELLKQENSAKEFAKSMNTVAGFFGTIWRGIMTPTREAAGMGKDLEFKETNSDKIERHLDTISTALTGQGIP